MYHIQNISRLLATPAADKAILHPILSPFLFSYLFKPHHIKVFQYSRIQFLYSNNIVTCCCHTANAIYMNIYIYIILYIYILMNDEYHLRKKKRNTEALHLTPTHSISVHSNSGHMKVCTHSPDSQGFSTAKKTSKKA